MGEIRAQQEVQREATRQAIAEARRHQEQCPVCRRMQTEPLRTAA